MSELNRQVVTDLCEQAVKAAELQLGLCPDQDIALDMVDVVRNVLKHRVKDHWKQLRKQSQAHAKLNAIGFAQAICQHIKEK